MNDIRTTTTLVCAILTFVIAFSTLAPRRVPRVPRAFSCFAADLGLWYSCQAIFRISDPAPGTLWEKVVFRAGASFAVAVPVLALWLFDAIVPQERTQGARLRRTYLPLTTLTAIVLIVAGLLDLGALRARALLFLYVFVLLALVLWSLFQRGQRSTSGVIRHRVSVLFVLGALAFVATIIDFASVVWQPSRQLSDQLPPVGAAISIVALYALREALLSELMFDTWGLFARLLAATLLGTVMALIFYGLSHYLSKHFDPTFLAAVLGIAVCVLFDLVRATVQEATTRAQRVLRRMPPPLDASMLERRLLHVLAVDDMKVVVVDALHASRRVKSAGLYLRDQDDAGFDREAVLGSGIPARIEVTTTRALLDRLQHDALVVLEDLERKVLSCRAVGIPPDPRDEAVLEAATRAGVPTGGVFARVQDETDHLIGLLLVVPDERTGDAFAAEELHALERIAGRVGAVMESSQVYAEMKARDRLAVIGQMTAGLAHEIRNPLGSIKGAAQLLVRLGSGAPVEPDSRKYLGIIVEEVDRLARILDSVLALAPRQPRVSPIDVNAVARRALQVFSAEPDHERLEVHEALVSDLPRVAIDPEQLQQVLMNLLRNSAQATQGRGKVSLSTTTRAARSSLIGRPGAHPLVVELRVTDDGPGFARKALEKLFMPFSTTKKGGTGLGLAISQRIVQEASGRIEVRRHEGEGTTVAVVLPAAMDALETLTPRPAVAAP